VGVGGQVTGEADLAVAIEDDEEQGPGVEIDAGIESGAGGRGEGKHGGSLPWGGVGKLPLPWSQRKAFMSIQELQPNGHATDGLLGVPSNRGRARPAGSGGKEVSRRRDQFRPVVLDVADRGADRV